MLAALASLVVPGSGQLARGALRRGALLLAAAALAAAALVVLAWRRPWGIDRGLVAAVLALDLALLLLRVGAAADLLRGRASRRAAAAVAAVAALTAVPHVVGGYLAVRGFAVLDTVFARSEPHDVVGARGGVLLAGGGGRPAAVAPLDELRHVLRLAPPPRPLEAGADVVAAGAAPRPWTTILLLGTDAGPGNWGARTDTMIVVALEHGTGRAAAFGIPRNLVNVPVESADPKLRRFPDALNGLYELANARPELFPGGGRDPGATVLKRTIARLLGIRIDYYALVDLLGFEEVVDALGGVTIHVKERLVDEVTRAAWGERKPRIDVLPGRTYRFDGRTALAYVRSRKASDDYTRMARQRCFLSALAAEVDPVRVLRGFTALADAFEANVRTDIPLDRLAGLVRLAAAVDPRKTLTQTFGRDYIARRRKRDGFPVPAVERMRASVREAILRPRAAEAGGGASRAAATC